VLIKKAYMYPYTHMLMLQSHGKSSRERAGGSNDDRSNDDRSSQGDRSPGSPRSPEGPEEDTGAGEEQDMDMSD